MSIPTLIYHWFLTTSSYWIGCPISPEFLSDTLLTTFNDPPRLLIVKAVAFSASLKVLASLRSTFVDIPEVIAKYTSFGSKPSGSLPSSLITLIDSPLENVCGAVNSI